MVQALSSTLQSLNNSHNLYKDFKNPLVSLVILISYLIKLMEIEKILPIILYIVLIIGLSIIFIQSVILLKRLNMMLKGFNQTQKALQDYVENPEKIKIILTDSIKTGIEDTVKTLIDRILDSVLFITIQKLYSKFKG